MLTMLSAVLIGLTLVLSDSKMAKKYQVFCWNDRLTICKILSTSPNDQSYAYWEVPKSLIKSN